MSPPLISDYKIHFAIKRILHTFLGGPVLWIRPIVLIVVQIVLFVVPIIELIVVRIVIKHRHHWRGESSLKRSLNDDIGVDKNDTDNGNDGASLAIDDEQGERESTNSGSIRQLNYFWIGLIVGITVLVVDLVLTLFISVLKTVDRGDTKKIQQIGRASCRERV